jgi:hypothetical protein
MESLTPTATAVTTDNSNGSAPSAIDEGVALVIREREAGIVSPLTRWLAEHPDLAVELAEFAAWDGRLRSVPGGGVATATPPDRLGRYEIRDELGRGGMGVVHKAFDTHLKRDVALKLLKRGSFLSADDRAKFLAEAKAVASLDHDRIVGVYDWGEDGGSPYLVMPLMAESLAARLKRLGPDRCRPAREAAAVVRDLALAMHHAHQRLLLHRDLKPGNVLLDADGRPHVADFGLARRLEVSVTSGLAGTAAYMAPEQARGDKALTTGVDIHALGAILFELLTGAPPFGTGEFVAVLARVKDEPPRRCARGGPTCPPTWRPSANAACGSCRRTATARVRSWPKTCGGSSTASRWPATGRRACGPASAGRSRPGARPPACSPGRRPLRGRHRPCSAPASSRPRSCWTPRRGSPGSAWRTTSSPGR